MGQSKCRNARDTIMYSFECKKCGSCCSLSPPYGAVFPEDKERWKDRPDILEYFDYPQKLPCKFLKDKECSIYDMRPFMCRASNFSEHKCYEKNRTIFRQNSEEDITGSS